MPKRACSQRVSAQRRAQLAPAAHDVGVGEADVLDPDRDVVEPDRVAARQRSGTSWWIVPSRSIDEVRADAGALAELDVGRVGGERVERGARASSSGVVLDDHLRLEQPRAVDRRSGGARRRASGAGGRRRRGSGPADRRLRAPPPRRARAAGRDGVHARGAWRARRRRPASAPGRAARPRRRSPPERRGSASSSRCRGSTGAAGREADAARVGAHRRGVGAAAQVHEPQRLVVVERQARAGRGGRAASARGSPAREAAARAREVRVERRGRRRASGTGSCG